MGNWSKVVKRITENPYTNLVVGLILLGTSSMEVWDSFVSEESHLGAHHGVMLFGLMQTIKALPDIMEAMEFIDKV